MGRPRYWLGVDSSLEHTLDRVPLRQRDLSAQELEPHAGAARRPRRATRHERTPREQGLHLRLLPRQLLDAGARHARRGARRRAGAAQRVTGRGRGRFAFTRCDRSPMTSCSSSGSTRRSGRGVDRRIDQWEEMFLPEKVQQRVRELHVRTADGQDVPLVKVEFPILTIGRYHVETAPPHWLAGFRAGRRGHWRIAAARRR